MAVIAMLYLGRDVAIPFTLALLFSFLLTPPVALVERTKLGRLPSVVLVMLLAFSAFGALGWVGAEQLTGILTQVPEYQANIQKKLDRPRAPGSTRLSEAIESIEAMATNLSPETAAANQRKGRAPIPVEIVRQHPSVLDGLSVVGGSLEGFVATAGAVLVFTLFMLLKRVDLRNRLFSLSLQGLGRIHMVTAAMDDAACRVSSYLLSLLTVNSCFGLLIGTGLYIGLPYFVFWGVLAIFVRFVPYLGTLMIAAGPFVLSLAVFDGWTKPLLVLGLWASVEAVITGFVEPYLYGSRTGISSLAVLISAVFWTVLWGPIGLVLSTPLTVCLVVLGRHVPQLEFLYILMGDELVLAPEAHYYQRLLSLDEDEAREVVEGTRRVKRLPKHSIRCSFRHSPFLSTTGMKALLAKTNSGLFMRRHETS